MNTIQIEEPTITLREDNPMRALCYIEGYIGCVMAEHGLTIDPELQKRFNMVYMAIEPPSIMNISAHVDCTGCKWEKYSRNIIPCSECIRSEDQVDQYEAVGVPHENK